MRSDVKEIAINWLLWDWRDFQTLVSMKIPYNEFKLIHFSV